MKARGLLLMALLLFLLLITVLVFTAWGLDSDPSTWPTSYQDDFQDPQSGWQVGETEFAKRTYVDGVYEIQVVDDWQIAWSRIPGDTEFVDFAAEVEVQVVEGTGQFGFIFGYQDSDNFYYFSIRTDGYYRLRLLSNGSWQTLVAWTVAPGFDGQGTNHMKVVTQEDRFTFFLNGILVGQFAETDFRGGQIAVCAGTFGVPGCRVRFDNLEVQRDPFSAGSGKVGILVSLFWGMTFKDVGVPRGHQALQFRP